VGSVTQPEVIVDTRVAMERDFIWDNFGARLSYWLSSFPIYNSLTSSR